jgi:hypothetical protein
MPRASWHWPPKSRNNLQGSAGRDFWWLLFDLHQLDGQRDAFDALARLCRRFETSPPGWTGTAPAPSPCRA